jgi:hypothetical protein
VGTTWISEFDISISLIISAKFDQAIRWAEAVYIREGKEIRPARE